MGKNKPGIHLFKQHNWKPIKKGEGYQGKPEYYWHIVASNGRIIARSSETYTRKGNAVKSIIIAADILHGAAFGDGYYDHSKPESPLQPYL